MKNFVILFNEKEGTSVLMRILNNFPEIDIIHQIKNRGYEPFNSYEVGYMMHSEIAKCLDNIFQNTSTSFQKLNEIYVQSANTTIENFSYHNSRGLKMRFQPRGGHTTEVTKKINNKTITKSEIEENYNLYKTIMLNLFKRNKVVVFFAVRQDILRWALSKYHGDGTGKPGHLQGKLRSGKITRDEIGKIYVNPEDFKKTVDKCHKIIKQKRKLFLECHEFGIESYPVFYEKFKNEKIEYFSEFLSRLDIDYSKEQISTILSLGEHFEKVHSDDISTFVENHEEITELFGDEQIQWL